jgi:rod shape determining protein RodA
VVGTPLPFLSYGGSNLISSFFGIALVLNCKAHSRLKLNKLL